MGTACSTPVSNSNEASGRRRLPRRNYDNNTYTSSSDEEVSHDHTTEGTGHHHTEILVPVQSGSPNPKLTPTSTKGGRPHHHSRGGSVDKTPHHPTHLQHSHPMSPATATTATGQGKSLNTPTTILSGSFASSSRSKSSHVAHHPQHLSHKHHQNILSPSITPMNVTLPSFERCEQLEYSIDGGDHSRSVVRRASFSTNTNHMQRSMPSVDHFAVSMDGVADLTGGGGSGVLSRKHQHQHRRSTGPQQHTRQHTVAAANHDPRSPTSAGGVGTTTAGFPVGPELASQSLCSLPSQELPGHGQGAIHMPQDHEPNSNLHLLANLPTTHVDEFHPPSVSDTECGDSHMQLLGRSSICSSQILPHGAPDVHMPNASQTLPTPKAGSPRLYYSRTNLSPRHFAYAQGVQTSSGFGGSSANSTARSKELHDEGPLPKQQRKSLIMSGSSSGGSTPQRKMSSTTSCETKVGSTTTTTILDTPILTYHKTTAILPQQSTEVFTVQENSSGSCTSRGGGGGGDADSFSGPLPPLPQLLPNDNALPPAALVQQ